MKQIRYEIECAPGTIIRAPGIAAFVAHRGRANKAIAVVLVDEANKKDFEKAVEGDKHVLGYKADPGGTGREETKYERK